MSNPHGPEHEARLEAFLAGAPSERTSDRRRSLEACSQCREELAELEGLVAELSAAGDEERTTLDRAAALQDPAGDARIDELVARVTGVPGAAPVGRALRQEPGQRWPLALLGAAAAVLFVVGLFRTGAAPVAVDDGPFLLGAATGLLEPAGEVRSFAATFRWDLAGDGWFIVNVYDAAGRRLATRRVETNACRWEPHERADWPARIRWEVLAFNGSGRLVESADAWVVRSP